MPTSISKSDQKAQKLAAFVKQEAKRLGFSDCRVVRPQSMDAATKGLRDFLAAGHHGTMEWMEETAERRASPAALWSDVGSVIMLTMNYGPEEDPRAILDKPECGAISVYARHRDYHDVIKGKLKELAGKLASRTKEDVKVFVDTAPVMEKPLAAAAGLGWQGKHTNLVSREFGSWLFLGSIFTTAKLAEDDSEVDHCGSCRSCLDACPTNAFPAPYQIDARRCISYLTIEHKGPIDRKFREAIGNHIYGCDDCLAACPWNKFAKAASEMKLVAREDLKAPSLDFLLQLDDKAFRQFFSGSPIKRIGRDRFIRNCLIAAGNSGEAALAPICRTLAHDRLPEIRALAIWALNRIEGLSSQTLKSYLPNDESDPYVLAELDHLETQ